MMFTQRSINRDSTDVDKNEAELLNITPFRQRTSVLGAYHCSTLFSPKH